MAKNSHQSKQNIPAASTSKEGRILRAKVMPADVGTVKVRAADQPKSDPPTKAMEKANRPKLIRDGFAMPEAEYQVLGEVKKACLRAGIEVKKSELLRIGVALVRDLSVADLKRILAGLAPLKPGRPKKEKAK